MSLSVTATPACPERCCVVTRDPDLMRQFHIRKNLGMGEVVIRPMYQLRGIHPEEGCYICAALEHPEQKPYYGPSVMTMTEQDYNDPEIIFL